MRIQITNEFAIKGKILEGIRLYPWSEGSIVLLFENNEATIFELFEFEDSLHMRIQRDNIYEIWDYEGLHRTGLITEEEMLKERKEREEERKKDKYKYYLSLKKEFEGLDK